MVEDNPQSYAAEHGGTAFLEAERLVAVDLKSRDFFERADKEFFACNTGLHAEGNPFVRIFPYDRYRGRSVLEIGCGMGCMASLWAQRGRAHDCGGPQRRRYRADAPAI